VLSFQLPGKVLAVPESAVIDTGSRTVVFIETMPGMFDGVEVMLGPRCGDCYPVVKGLEAGQRVAVSGAFLLDAETRLNPSLASSYFGAASRAQPSSPSSSVTVAGSTEGRSPLAKLDRGDRLLAERQKICPVTRKALGSMGTPTRLVVADRVVFLCCDGCKDALEAEPARYLAVLPAQPSP
jgi:membrane fusion protein, copper/silver efflux system